MIPVAYVRNFEFDGNHEGEKLIIEYLNWN